MNKLIIKTSFILLLIITLTSSTMQKKLVWDNLTDIEFKYTLDNETGVWFKKPIFNNLITYYDYKLIQIQGFMIPSDVNKVSDKCFVSKFPNAACFFCQKADASTIIEVHLKTPQKITTDEVKIVKGKLRLHNTMGSMPYILEGAEFVE